MPRPRRRRDTGTSLFPFLSVLACVIGTLTLVIAALALRQVASELAGDRPDDMRETSEIRGSVAGLRERLASASAARAELDALRAALRARGIDPNAPDDQIEQALSELREEASLAARVEEFERAKAEQLKAIANARIELESVLPPDDAGIELQPAGVGPALTPFFVECRRETVRLHRPDEAWSIPLYVAQPDDRARFERFLSGVIDTPRATVILLLRPDGVASFRRVERILENRGVRFGKLPLPGRGAIDFRLVGGASS